MVDAKEEVKTVIPEGHLGNLTEEQDLALKEIRNFIQELGHSLAHYDDYFLLRYLRARKFNLDNTKLMMDNMFKWRETNDVDNIHQLVFEEKDQVQKYYPHNYHKIDKVGRVIYIERLGQFKPKELFEISTEERMIKQNIQSYESIINFRYPCTSAMHGRRIETSLNILDLKGVSLSLVNKRIYGLIQTASKISQDYYPEIMGAMYIVNAPMLFTGIWAVCRSFIDEKTRAKIHIKGSKYEKDLLELVDEESLPDFLGGKCTCAEIGGCMIGDAGPWNDFEYLRPFHIKRKSDGVVFRQEKRVEE